MTAFACLGVLAVICVLFAWRPPLPIAAWESVPRPSSFTLEPLVTSDAAPSFTGPHAELYERAWRESQSDAARELLADEHIAEYEIQRLERRYGSCLAEQGLSLTSYSPAEGISLETHGMGEKDFTVRSAFCDEVTGQGWISMIFASENRDPDAKTWDEHVVECLIRGSAVPDDYTAEQYAADYPTRAFPFITDDGRDTFEQCFRDPRSGQRRTASLTPELADACGHRLRKRDPFPEFGHGRAPPPTVGTPANVCGAKRAPLP